MTVRVHLRHTKSYRIEMNKLQKTICTLIALIPFINVSAQKADSVEMGQGYGNDVYYSFANGEVKKVANNTWDLAFRTGFRTDAIFINSVSSSTAQRSTKLYLYPKGDKTAWSTFDTSGWKGWLEYQNTDTSWEFGAFNRAAGTFPDFSWGIYNPVTKIVEGDSLYLLEITNGSNKVYKKLFIMDKNFGVWHFKYADVDGANEVVDSIVASNGNAKLLDYYSIIDGADVAHEPDSVKDWDLLFTRYHEWITMPAPGSYYPVMGVLTNKGVKVAEKRSIDKLTYDVANLTAGDYKEFRNIIGSDWKFFDNNTFSWKLIDSLAYFVQLQNGSVWKIYFTGFGGTGNGKSVFNKTKVQPGLSVNPAATVASFGVYPNPAATSVSVVFENRANSVSNTLKIYDMDGKVVATHTLENAPGFYTSEVNIEQLPAGVYVMSIENGGFNITQKLIKN